MKCFFSTNIRAPVVTYKKIEVYMKNHTFYFYENDEGIAVNFNLHAFDGVSIRVIFCSPNPVMEK